MAEKTNKPLIGKLGIRKGQTVYFINAPNDYIIKLGKLPSDVFTAKKLNRPVDFIQGFYIKKSKLVADTLLFKQYLELNGSLWVCWPKQSAVKAGLAESDITEDSLREILLPLNLVDTKVAAITDVWSGLKFVWRRM